MMTMKNMFELDGRTYEVNDKGNRFFVSYGNIVRKRIGQSTYEQAWEQYLKEAQDAADAAEAEELANWEAEADAELKDREDLKAEKDKETEEAFNGKKVQPKAKKSAKPRRSKDVAFEMDSLHGKITLTAKQVEFLKLLPTTCFWEDGLESILWCDCIAEDIGWNPMSVGAMISTLREKSLVSVVKDMSRKGHPKAMNLTELGQVVAKKLGLD